MSFLALTIANNNFNTKDKSVHCYFTNSNGDNNEVFEQIEEQTTSSVSRYIKFNFTSRTSTTINYNFSSDTSGVKTIDGRNNSTTNFRGLLTANYNNSTAFTDNRIVTNVDDLQYYMPSAICIVQASFVSADTAGHGTGFVIGNNLILTAAHNIYNGSVFNLNAEVGFVLQNYTSNGQDVTAHYEIKNAYLPINFYNNYGNTDYDWAIVELDSSVDLVQNYGALNIGSNYTLSSAYSTASGYSTDFGDLKLVTSSAYGVMHSYDKRFDLYNYCNSGMSGGPIIYYYEDPITLEYNRVCVGIISQKVVNSNTSAIIYSKACKITNNLIDLANTIRGGN